MKDGSQWITGIERCPGTCGGATWRAFLCLCHYSHTLFSHTLVLKLPLFIGIITLIHRVTDTTATLESFPRAYIMTWSTTLRPGLLKVRTSEVTKPRVVPDAHPPTSFTSFPQAYSRLRLENAKYTHPSWPFSVETFSTHCLTYTFITVAVGTYFIFTFSVPSSARHLRKCV